MQEKGRETAIAPDPIFPTCKMTILGAVVGLKGRDNELLYLPEAAQENKSRQACWQWQEQEHPAKPWENLQPSSKWDSGIQTSAES